MTRIDAFLLALALVGVPAVSRAQASVPPIDVELEVDVPAMIKSWPNTLQQKIMDDVHNRLITVLKERGSLQAWRFDRSVADARARFSFRVVEEQTNVISVVLQFSVLDTVSKQWQASQKWSAVWMQPGDLQSRGWPNASVAFEQLKKAFERDLLTDERERSIHDALKAIVPVTIGAHWLSGASEPTIVLALPWNSYAGLRESHFRLLCERGTQIHELLSVGRGKGLYPQLNEVPAYDALIAVLVRVADITASDLSQLLPKEVYLAEYRRPSLFHE